jgi:hypothetical protein
VDHVDRLEITLRTAREDLGSYRFRRWTEEKIIGRIPGSAKMSDRGGMAACATGSA